MIQHTKNSINLKIAPAMAALPERAHDALANTATLCRLQQNDVLYYQGTMATAFYIVQAGGVRLMEYVQSGQGVTLKVYGPGDIFGLLAVSAAFPHPSQVEAIEDETLVIAINGADARHLMHTHPALAVAVIDLLISHIHDAHHRIRHMAVERVDQRLARALLHYGKKFGQPEADGVLVIDVPLSQQDLADFCSTTVETVSRTLKGWEKQGYIRQSRLHLDLLDTDALHRITEHGQRM